MLLEPLRQRSDGIVYFRPKCYFLSAISKHHPLRQNFSVILRLRKLAKRIPLRNEYATRSSIENASDRLKSLATEDDLVVLYFSSHGTPPDKFGGVHESSIFTYYFLQGLQSYNVTIGEAFDYSKPLVYSSAEEEAEEEKGIDIDQHPQLTPSCREWNMSIAVSGR